MEGIHHGSQIASQLLDVAVRVSSVRHFVVQQMVRGHSTILTNSIKRESFDLNYNSLVRINPIIVLGYFTGERPQAAIKRPW